MGFEGTDSPRMSGRQVGRQVCELLADGLTQRLAAHATPGQTLAQSPTMSSIKIPCVCVCVCVPVLRVRLGPAVLTGCDFPSRAVQPRPQQVFGDDLPDSQDGEQPGPSRRKRQPSMSETMPLYTLCKEDLESMDKEVSPRCPLATGGGSVGRDWSVCGQRRRQLSDPTWGPWCPACGLWAASQRRL